MDGDNNPMQKITLHYQIDRTEYVLTEDELSRLENGSKAPYRDICLATAGIAIPSLINATGYIKNPFEWSYALFLNSLIGGICLLGAIVLGKLWHTNRNEIYDLIKIIREKPKIEVQVVSTGASSSTIIGDKNSATSA